MYGAPNTRRLLKYLHQSFQAPMTKTKIATSPRHFHLPLHVTACSKPQLVCGAPIQVSDSHCSSQGTGCASSATASVDEGSSNPAKKRKLFKKPLKRGAMVGGTDCAKIFDKVGPGASWKEKKGRARKLTIHRGDQGPRNIKEWQRGQNITIHPGDSSSEDEVLGWTDSGLMLRNLFESNTSAEKSKKEVSGQRKVEGNPARKEGDGC